MGSSGGGPYDAPDPIEGPVSSLIDRQHSFILSGSPALQPIPSATYQPEITSVSTLQFVGETPAITYIQAPATTPGPSQPAITKERLTVPVRVMAFSIYAIANGLKEVRPYHIAVALGYVKGYGKPVKEAIRSFNQVYDAIYQLEDYGVLTKVGRGRYKVNIDVALKYANSIPQGFHKRDIVALRGHNSPLGLPQHWAEVLVRRQLYEEALTTATQNTTPSCLAQLLYPITYLATASGHVKAVDLPALYLIPSKALLHRSKVYCASAPGSPKPLCSPYRSQLTRHLTPLCPICPPLSLYPAPAGPVRVVGPLADYERRLIPLSALPRNARKYELGYQLYDPALYSFHRLFNVKVKYRNGLIYVTVKPRRYVVKRCLSTALTALPFILHRYLSLLISALNAIADYGRSYTGLSTPELMARSGSTLMEALYRKPKPRPAYEPPRLEFKEVRYRVKRYDPDRRDFRWRYVRVGEGLTYSGLLALLGELEDFRAERPYRLTYLELTLALPDPTGQAVRYLGAGYLYIYHNPNKDPEGAVRVEFRPYKHVTKYVAPEDLNVMFYGLAIALTVPVDLAMRAGATAWLT